MKLVVTQQVSSIFNVARDKKTLIVAPFDNAVGKVPLSILQVIGDLIVGSGAGSADRLGAGSAGTVLTSNGPASLPSWQSPSGGGSSNLTNKSNLAVSAGDVVIIDSTNDSAFTTTAVDSDLRVCGVAGESINVNSVGKVVSVFGVTSTVNCDTGSVSRGDWLVSSSTTGKARSAGAFKPPAGFAIALTAKGAGSNGSITALIMPSIPFAISGNTGYSIGGANASSYLTNSQRFSNASATWTNVAGASLSTGAQEQAGLGNTNIAGYSIAGLLSGGRTVNGNKMPFSTEVFASASSTNLASASCDFPIGGANVSSKGYVSGGYNGSSYLTAISMITYANDTRSTLAAVLSVGRYYPSAISDGSYVYIVAGSNGGDIGTCDKINASNDTCSANAGGNVTAGRQYNGPSFPATAGYLTANGLSQKITYSSGISSSVTSIPPTNHSYHSGVTDGVNIGWVSGTAGSPYSASDRFTKTTEVYSADTGAVLATGKLSTACFNNGAF